MKKIWLTMAFVFLFAGLVHAGPFLVCDLPPTGTEITQTQISYSVGSAGETLVAGSVIIKGSDFLLYDLGSMPVGKYSFKARWADSTGWWSDWTDPITAGKPGKPGALKIIQ